MRRVEGKRGSAWEVRWRDPRPRKKRFRTKAEAVAFERETLHDLATGTYRDPSLAKVTFADWHAVWWPTVPNGRSPGTVVHYEAVLRRHVLPYLGPERLARLRRIDLEAWVAALLGKGLSSSTVRTARTLAGMVLGSAVESGVVLTNPAAGLRVANVPVRHRDALTVPQLEALADAAGEWWRPLFLVLAYGGLRFGEAAALQRRHYDPLHGTLLVERTQKRVGGRLTFGPTKTNKARTVVLPDDVNGALAAHVAAHVPGGPEALVFTTQAGAMLQNSNFRVRVFDPAVRAAGLAEWVTPHILRHSCATLAARAGVPVHDNARMLGHSPAENLRTYQHAYEDGAREAARAVARARAEALRRGVEPVEIGGRAPKSRPSSVPGEGGRAEKAR